jgi:glutaredoxin
VLPIPLVTLYGKPDCHLCDEARAVVLAVREEREFELREVDISLDPALGRDYGERIPVVAVDGDEHFQFHVDPDRLRELLGGGSKPAGGASVRDH